MARKGRADGTNFARETAAELTRPFPEPPHPLSERAQKYWPRVLNSKRLTLWTEADLDTAWGLCEDFAKVEEFRQLLQRSPAFGKDDRGRIIEHPALKQIETIERRIQATKRHLQINSAATNGPSHHQAGKNATARHMASTFDDDDDLFARPH